MLRRPAWRTGLALAVLAVLCAPSTALADTFKRDRTLLPTGIRDGASGSAAASHSSSTGGAFLHMAIGLAVVVAVIYGVYLALRSWGKAKRGIKKKAGLGGELIEVVATAGLGHNRAVHLLRLGDELLLVGSADQSVTPLRVYGPDEAAAMERQLGLRPGEAGALVPTDGTTAAKESWKGNNWAGVSGMADELRRRTTRG